MPRIIGKARTVVSIDGLQIDELAGNVATSDDTLSIAHVTITKPTSEPWLTLDYDEWICVRRGQMDLLFVKEDGTEATLTVREGETCFVGRGERFRPVFPVAPTEYVPVCRPAFRPERCVREEDEAANDVTAKLRTLHGGESVTSSESREASAAADAKDVLYHMCERERWDKAVASRTAYFPPTFAVDGRFTHATAVPSRLIDTANHFYQESKADWICLRLSRRALVDVGIVTVDEGGLPVGERAVSDQIREEKWVCPHIYGGLPTREDLGVLTGTYPMARSEEGRFLNIVGLTD